MHLYNSLTRNKEPLAPAGDLITLYVCGVTPYDTTHLGHAATYCFFDILIRTLEYQGFRVRYVQNVTDIDDDILREAKKRNDEWLRLGNRWTAHFITDMMALNVRPPDVYPRATETIAEIVAAVQRLIDRGVAYASGGNVYFDVGAFDRYGTLSRIPKEQMLPVANERGNRPDDPLKQDPLDFVLWQKQNADEPAWDSPWGPGRPGWHIECSTMSEKYLGQMIDIHGGGSDLIFPHHESEIAQAECATGHSPFVRIWMHTAMVELDGVKMSKSLGNLVMVRDLLKTFSADAIRLYIATHSYRIPWGYDEAALRQAERQAERLRQAVTVNGGRTPLEGEDTAGAGVLAALNDDLNTPNALRALNSLADHIVQAAASGHNVTFLQNTLRQMAGLFGLRLDKAAPEERVTEGWNAQLQRFPV